MIKWKKARHHHVNSQGFFFKACRVWKVQRCCYYGSDELLRMCVQAVVKSFVFMETNKPCHICATCLINLHEDVCYDFLNLWWKQPKILFYIFFFSFQLDANETEGRKNRIRPDFQEDPSFKRMTDYNHTAVHSPTDIYDGCECIVTHTHTYQSGYHGYGWHTNPLWNVVYRLCLKQSCP